MTSSTIAAPHAPGLDADSIGARRRHGLLLDVGEVGEVRELLATHTRPGNVVDLLEAVR